MCQRADTIVYSISTNISATKDKGDDVLKTISDATGGRAFYPVRIEDVATGFRSIEEELRSQYLLIYRPANFRADGAFRTIYLHAIDPRYQVSTRKGYFAPRPPLVTLCTIANLRRHELAPPSVISAENLLFQPVRRGESLEGRKFENRRVTPVKIPCLTHQDTMRLHLHLASALFATSLAAFPQPPAAPPLPPSFATLADQPATHTGVVFDRNMMQIAQGFLQSSGLDEKRAAIGTDQHQLRHLQVSPASLLHA